MLNVLLGLNIIDQCLKQISSSACEVQDCISDLKSGCDCSCSRAALTFLPTLEPNCKNGKLEYQAYFGLFFPRCQCSDNYLGYNCTRSKNQKQFKKKLSTLPFLISK